MDSRFGLGLRARSALMKPAPKRQLRSLFPDQDSKLGIGLLSIALAYFPSEQWYSYVFSAYFFTWRNIIPVIINVNLKYVTTVLED